LIIAIGELEPNGGRGREVIYWLGLGGGAQDRAAARAMIGGGRPAGPGQQQF
jgi:hypothetical protein